MLNNLRLIFLAMALFVSAVIFSSPALTPTHSIVYAAVVSCGPYSDPAWDPCNGTYGDDIMRGDSGHNKMNGLDGDDQLSGNPGNDALHGGYGNDVLSGGPGDDDLYGSFGVDSFKCGAGNDQISYFSPSEGDTKSNDCERLWP